MPKYSQELKMKVIKYCIEEYHSYGEAARNFIKAISKCVKNIKNLKLMEVKATEMKLEKCNICPRNCRSK